MPEICTMMKAQDALAKRIPLHKRIWMEEKVDGVPGVTVLSPPRSVVVSRQGKSITSALHVQDALLRVRSHLSPSAGALFSTVIGELKVPTLPFEESAGRTRAKAACPEQVLYMFDVQNSLIYSDRKRLLDEAAAIAQELGLSCIQRPQSFGSVVLRTDEERIELIKRLFSTVEERGLEGMMLRPEDGLYFVGKRSWDMQRIVLTPTIDLRVVGFEEAKSAGGAPLCMVGKVIVQRNGETECVGPGKMTHDMRRAVWAAQDQYIGKIAKVKYKGGKTANYKSLRQATFQCWHPDKDEPDA